MHFAELVADPIEMARRIYDNFGLDLDDAAERRMHRFLADNPQGKHGKHSYRLEQFALDPEVERERFRFYQDFYRVQTEPID
jgi:hypothetical protein